jgi:hypothetical protein
MVVPAGAVITAAGRLADCEGESSIILPEGAGSGVQVACAKTAVGAISQAAASSPTNDRKYLNATAPRSEGPQDAGGEEPCGNRHEPYKAAIDLSTLKMRRATSQPMLCRNASGHADWLSRMTFIVTDGDIAGDRPVGCDTSHCAQEIHTGSNYPSLDPLLEHALIQQKTIN